MRTMILSVLACSSLATANVFDMPAGQTSLETVTVGNPGGGSLPVDYVFRMGKFEVTAGQYCQFLNAVAKTETYGLYSPDMADPTGIIKGCNIQRSGVAGSFTYSVAGEWANRPVNFVSWGDAARFCNWLSNGQPTGTLTGDPVQDAALTEDGSYPLRGATVDVDLMAVTRNSDARFVIPTGAEWVKAGYHKNDGATGNCWFYPTGTDNTLSNRLADPDPGNSANFTYNGTVSVGAPYWRSEAGAFANSSSPYGTFDQGGNVTEWTEDGQDGMFRVHRGGAWDGLIHDLAIGSVSRGNPSVSGYIIGFRVAYVPEPGTLMLLTLGGVAVMRRCVRR